MNNTEDCERNFCNDADWETDREREDDIPDVWLEKMLLSE